MARAQTTTSGAPDADLLDRYRRAGDLTALEVLVERYRRPLFALIGRSSGTMRGAEDIVQEVWLRVLKNPGSFRGGQFAGWLFRICRNLLIDRSRKRRELNERDAAADGATPLTERLVDPGEGPAAALMRGEASACLARVVAELPIEQREVFVMRTEGGLRFRDIAAAQNCSINTVLARMRYALDRIRGRMRDWAREEEHEKDSL